MILTRLSLLGALLVLSCAPTPDPAPQKSPENSKAKRNRDLPRTIKAEKPKYTAQELRFRLFPQIFRATEGDPAEGFDGGEGLLSLAPELGLRIVPGVRDRGFLRAATREELSAVDGLGIDRNEMYRVNLAGLLREASMLSIGDPSAGRFLYLDTDASAGIEALVLLPEIWQKAEESLGRSAVLVLPDAGHCRFLPLGPTQMLAEMSKDCATWFDQASRPLCSGVVHRDGEGRLRLGQDFAKLASAVRSMRR